MRHHLGWPEPGGLSTPVACCNEGCGNSAAEHEHRADHHQAGSRKNHLGVPWNPTKVRRDLGPEHDPRVLHVILDLVQEGRFDFGPDSHELLPVREAQGCAFQGHWTKPKQEKETH
jgi:hypothetical protein